MSSTTDKYIGSGRLQERGIAIAANNQKTPVVQVAPATADTFVDDLVVLSASDVKNNTLLPDSTQSVILESKETTIVQYSDGPWISFNFDDGFESAYQNALPIMNVAGFKTTQYIITGVIGVKDYVTVEELYDMQLHGHEIGSHTQTHSNLVHLSLDQAQNEIFDSKKDLFDLGISATTFSYPNGSVNPAIENLVKEAGFVGARITKPGFNDATTDPYLLWYFGVNESTTFPIIQHEIDRAVKNKKWLILVFHRIDESPGAYYENVSHEIVQQIVDYVNQNHIRVVTNAQGLQMLREKSVTES